MNMDIQTNRLSVRINERIFISEAKTLFTTMFLIEPWWSWAVGVGSWALSGVNRDSRKNVDWTAGQASLCKIVCQENTVRWPLHLCTRVHKIAYCCRCVMWRFLISASIIRTAFSLLVLRKRKLGLPEAMTYKLMDWLLAIHSNQ